ncbi:MAG: saccharopine dehydrogenase C-terminal domain-containing protein [Ferruginibacter sp.]
MKKIVLFGAGKSASVLIDYLLVQATENNWTIFVADANKKLIEEKTKHHPKATPVELDIKDDVKRGELVAASDIVISMMPPALHILIAKDCIEYGKNLLTASYADDEIKALQKAVEDKGLLFLCEMGLDPGIDHMSAMQLLDEIKTSGAVVNSFKSHCGGLIAPESDDNPWHYKITWNPRNIVLAGKSGAVYKQDGIMITENYESLFDAARKVMTGSDEVPVLSYYPNRNSLPYIDLYGLHEAETFIRTTLRYPDFMYGWKNVVDLKLTDETLAYETDGRTLHDFFKEHLANNGFGDWLEEKLSERFAQTKSLLENLMKIMEAEEEAKLEGEEPVDNFMIVDEAGGLKNIELDEVKDFATSTVAIKMHEANLTLKQLFYLGMDDTETMINKGKCSAADVLQLSLEQKLALKPADKDMIVMLHEIEYTINEKRNSIHSSLLVKGDDSIHTAMAKTVGLPLGIAAKLILSGQINMKGIHIPVTKEIYDPVLKELKIHGIEFVETRKQL